MNHYCFLFFLLINQLILFCLQPLPDEAFEELIAVEYDIPKIRDSLSTIEEEHQEYDVPRNCIIKVR